MRQTLDVQLLATLAIFAGPIAITNTPVKLVYFPTILFLAPSLLLIILKFNLTTQSRTLIKHIIFRANQAQESNRFD